MSIQDRLLEVGISAADWPGPANREQLERRVRYVARGISSTVPIFATRGQGTRLEDVDGNVYLGFAIGIGTLAVGHCHPKVVAAVKAQVDNFLHTCFSVARYRPYVDGAVAFQFDRKGMIRVKGTGDDVMLAAIDAGADDVQEEGEESVIYTAPQDLAKVRDTLKDAGLEILEAELTYVPKNTVEVTDRETAGKIMRLMDALDEVDDVTNTHVNFDIPEALLS